MAIFSDGWEGRQLCGSRILPGGGFQLWKPKVAVIVKRNCTSEVSYLRPWSRVYLSALEALGFSILEYEFSHILETPILSFVTSSWTSKIDKNSILYCNQFEIFLCYYPLYKFAFHLIFMKNLGLWLCNLKRHSEWSEARIFYDISAEK